MNTPLDRHNAMKSWRSLQGGHLLQSRMSGRVHLMMMLSMLVMGGVFRFVGYPPERVALLFAIPVITGTLEYWLIHRSKSSNENRQRLMHLVGLIGLTFMVGVTGGLQGPLGAFLFLVALIPSLFFESVRYLVFQQIYVLIAVLTLTLLPEDILGPTLPRTQHAILSASISIFAFVVIVLRVRQVMRLSRESARELAQMREDKIAETAERWHAFKGSRVALLTS